MLRDTASHDGAHSLNVAFWNLGRRALSECLVALIREFSIDVLVLAEYGDYDAVSGALTASAWRQASLIAIRSLSSTDHPMKSPSRATKA
jgi:hypothetical protein